MQTYLLCLAAYLTGWGLVNILLWPLVKRRYLWAETRNLRRRQTRLDRSAEALAKSLVQQAEVIGGATLLAMLREKHDD